MRRRMTCAPAVSGLRWRSRSESFKTWSGGEAQVMLAEAGAPGWHRSHLGLERGWVQAPLTALSHDLMRSG